MLIAEFLTVALVHFLAVISPGPDFAVVLKQSISHGRFIGIITSIGVGTGILIHIAYTLLGIGLIISQSVVVFSILKYLGAAYLLYIGFKALKSKAVEHNETETFTTSPQKAMTIKKAFLLGFVTNGLNPKATLFFLSLFTVVLSPETPVYAQSIYGLYMAVATAILFSVMSIIFTTEPVRQQFYRIGHWFDRVMGAALIGLGLKLAVTEQ